MTDYSQLYADLKDTPLEPWLETLPAQIDAVFKEKPHGDLPRWQDALNQLPVIRPEKLNLDSPKVGVDAKLPPELKGQTIEALKQFHPWRKGPYRIADIFIDCEWRSDWKWERIKNSISPLNNRLILDVGCGNGYHAWRMAGSGARLVIGVDPTLLYTLQYQAIRRFIGENTSVYVLPLAGEDVPRIGGFDTVFSMGVLYHRRSPFDHLQELRGCLREGGELVLETLVIEGGSREVLVPEGRYARMRNVWFIPTPELMKSWLKRVGFSDVEIVDITQTTVEEQRSTEWMTFQSLTDCLDPENPNQTVEGLPAPIRATFVARR